MVYIVSPNGQVYEIAGCNYIRYDSNHHQLYTREGGRRLRVVPTSWWVTFEPPYQETPKEFCSEQIIRFIRECDAVAVSGLKRELRKFNARTLTWDEKKKKRGR